MKRAVSCLEYKLSHGCWPAVGRAGHSWNLLGLNYGHARPPASICSGFTLARPLVMRSTRVDQLAGRAFNNVTERRFWDQQEMSLHTATGRSLPKDMV